MLNRFMLIYCPTVDLSVSQSGPHQDLKGVLSCSTFRAQIFDFRYPWFTVCNLLRLQNFVTLSHASVLINQVHHLLPVGVSFAIAIEANGPRHFIAWLDKAKCEITMLRAKSELI